MPYATQCLRQLEAGIRLKKSEAAAYKAAGMDLDATRATTQAKQLTNRYKTISGEMGLRTHSWRTGAVGTTATAKASTAKAADYTVSGLSKLSRPELEKLATEAYIEQNAGLDIAEARRRAKALMDGNTTPQLVKYVNRNKGLLSDANVERMGGVGSAPNAFKVTNQAYRELLTPVDAQKLFSEQVITPGAIPAMTAYTLKPVAAALNGYLRGVNRPSGIITPLLDAMINKLDKAMMDYRIPQPVVTFRAISSKHLPVAENGDILIDKAFLSTTPLRSAAIQFKEKYSLDVILELRIPAKYGEGIYIGNKSFHPSE